MRYGPPSDGHAYYLALFHLRQTSALDAAWIRLLPDQVPRGHAEPTILCRCAGRQQVAQDEYGHAYLDRMMRSAVRLRQVRMPKDMPPQQQQIGDAWAYLVGRCDDCGTVWWAPLEVAAAGA